MVYRTRLSSVGLCTLHVSVPDVQSRPLELLRMAREGAIRSNPDAHMPCAPSQHILTRRLERGRPAAAARGARVWCGERVAAAGVGDVRASTHA